MTSKVKVLVRLLTIAVVMSLFIPAALALTGWKNAGSGFARSSDGVYQSTVTLQATTNKNPQDFRIHFQSKTKQYGGATYYSITAYCYNEGGTGSTSVSLSGTKTKDGPFNIAPFARSLVKAFDYCRAYVYVTNTYASLQGRYGSFDPMVSIQAKYN